jgi:hypothetical protein
MNQDEYRFAKNIVKLKENVNKAIEYIKENFGVKGVYDEENGILNLFVSNVNEGLQLLAAKEYIDNNFDPDFLTTNLK